MNTNKNVILERGQILINYKYKLIYLPVFKTGNSTINTILRTYYNFEILNSNNNINKVIKFVNSKNNNINNFTYKKLKKFKKFFKFTFVRNPYSRFNSTYKYLSIMNSDIINPNNVFINNNSIVNLNNIFINNNDTINFNNDFINSDFNLDNTEFNYYCFTHFLPQTCYYNINYDYIGKTENLDEDLIKLLIMFNIPITHFNFLKKELKCNNTNNIKDITYSTELINNINKYYDKDFCMFNYDKINNSADIINPNYKRYDEIYLKYKNYFSEIDLNNHLNSLLEDTPIANIFSFNDTLLDNKRKLKTWDIDISECNYINIFTI